MNTQVDLALSQVIKKIEPLTRFDRNSLVQESDRVRVTTGKAFWQFSPNIYVNSEDHTGRLPSRATQTNDVGKLHEAAQQTLKSAWEALPQRIQTWLQANERTDRILEPVNCFNGPKIFGYEYECKTCGGKGWVICPTCPVKHKGYLECSKCPDKHKGRIDCSKCKNFWGNSTGEIDCKGCSGTGKKNRQTCPTCGGQKKFVCSKCSGEKTITCDECHGSGKINCSTCGTTGRVPCVTCASTGWLHSLRIVECTVRESFTVDLNDEKPEVVQQLRSRKLDSLRELASVTQVPPTVQSNVVKREYEVECIITEIRLQAAEKSRELIGFGVKAKIFDYQAIVSDLLEADLAALEQEILQTPFRLWGNPTDLLNMTKLFLASEVNVQVDDPRWIREHIITQDYLELAKNSLRSGLEKLFFTQIGLALVVTVMLPVVIFLVSHFTGLREMIGLWTLVPPVLAAVAAWIFLERRARQHLVLALEEKFDERVDGLLHAYRILWKPRGAAMALAVIFLLIAALVPLP